MSAALINRSLTNIRTELEFLLDSEIIDEKLMNALSEALPPKYTKNMPTWGLDKLEGSKLNTENGKSSTDSDKAVDSVTQGIAKTTVQDEIASPNPPAKLPPRKAAEPIGYCKALYNYDAQEPDDLALQKDDKVAVVEHLSLDWWKGYKLTEGPEKAGIFPANYVSVISAVEFELGLKEKAAFEPHRASPAAPPYEVVSSQPSYGQMVPQAPYGQMPPQPSYGQYQPYNQGQVQPSYGGYAQYPPPSTNYYPQQVQQQQQPEQQVQGSLNHKVDEQVKKFGGKLGNAAIFGAGATIGSNIVNSIF